MRRFRSRTVNRNPRLVVDGRMILTDPLKEYGVYTPRKQRLVINPEQPMNKKVVRTFGGNAFDDWVRSQGLDLSQFERSKDKSPGVRYLGSVKKKSTFTKDLDDSEDDDEDDENEGGGIVGELVGAIPTFIGNLVDFIDSRTNHPPTGKSSRGRGRTARGGRRI